MKKIRSLYMTEEVKKNLEKTRSELKDPTTRTNAFIEDLKKESLPGLLLRQLGERAALALFDLGEIKYLREITSFALSLERIHQDKESEK